MKMGRRCNDSAGFTIVEVMIVLAVSGIMFVAAVLLVNGRQGRTEFVTAINNLQQELQQTINETSSGYYPNSGNIKCSGSVSGPVTLTTSTSSQGQNVGCLFLGKALQFGLTTPYTQNQIGVLTLVGNQFQNDGSTSVINLGQSLPRAIYPATTGETTFPQSVPDGSVLINLQNGLSVATSSSGCSGGGGMCYITSGTPTQTGVVAFVAGDSGGNITSSDGLGGLKPGTEQYSLYGVKAAVSPTSAPNQSLMAATRAIGNNAAQGASGLAPADSVSICMASATDNESGLITIDAGLHVSLQIKPGLVC